MKRLISLLGAFALLLGLVVVSVAYAPQANAFPLTGAHQASFSCTAPSGAPQRLTIEWDLTFTGVNSIDWNLYSWQMKKATYTGPGMGGQGIQGKVTYRNMKPGGASTLWRSLAGGGANGPKIFPNGTAAGPAPVVREDGVNGVNWTPATIVQSLTGEYDRDHVFYVVIDNSGTTHDCTLYYDLGLPDSAPEGSPTVGSNITDFECSHPDIASGAPQRLAVEYQVTDLGTVVSPTGRTHDFAVQLTEAAYQGPPIDILSVSVPEYPGGPDIGLRPVDDPATAAAWGPGVDDFLQTQGIAGVHFPVVTVKMPVGSTAPIEMKTVFLYPLGGPEPLVCYSYQDITVEGNQLLDHTGDLQCTGLPGGDGPLGHLRVKAEWEQNSALNTRLKAYPSGIAEPGSGVLLFNDSDYWLRFPGPGPSGSGFLYSVDPSDPAPGPFGTLAGDFVLPPNTTEYLPVYDAAWDGDNPFRVWSSEDMALSIVANVYDENNEFQCGQGVVNVFSSPI